MHHNSPQSSLVWILMVDYQHYPANLWFSDTSFSQYIYNYNNWKLINNLLPLFWRYVYLLRYTCCLRYLCGFFFESSFGILCSCLCDFVIFSAILFPTRLFAVLAVFWINLFEAVLRTSNIHVHTTHKKQ